MMRFFRTVAITFSLYSRIPMPGFNWEEEDMPFCMSVFPWIGGVIGAIYFGVVYFGKLLSIPNIALALMITAVPLIITGGFHVDGYMDTKDALNSYKSREEKLEILKDPHTGAFAVICLAISGLVFIAMQTIVLSDDHFLKMSAVLACGFFLARCLSAFGVIILEPARKDGMMKKESADSLKKKNTNLTVLAMETIAILVVMALINILAMVFAVVFAAVWFLIYANRTKMIFGGTTGDTAGYFLVKCELYIAVSQAIFCLIF